MKKFIQALLTKILIGWYLLLKKSRNLAFLVRKLLTNLTLQWVFLFGILMISVVIIFLGNLFYPFLSTQKDLLKESDIKSNQLEPVNSAKTEIPDITSDSTEIHKGRTRELPERKLGDSQVKMIGLLPIQSFGANPLMLLTYESSESGYFSKKTKELTYFLPGERQEFITQYTGELKAAGWEIQEKPAIQGLVNAAAQPSIFYVRKNGVVFGIQIFEDIMKSMEGKPVLKVSLMNWIDQNIVFRRQPKMEVLDIPPLPKREITLEASVGYIEQTNGSLTKVGDTYYFAMDGLPESTSSVITKKLEEIEYVVSGGKLPETVSIDQTVVPPVVPVATVPPEVPVPPEIREFIPFSIQSEIPKTDLKSIVSSPKWQYFISSKDGQYFELGFSQNIPGKLDPVDGKTIITLRTNVNRFQEGVEYFKTNTNLYSYSGVTTLANKEVYVSYESAKISDQSSPLLDGTYLPDPIIFSIENKETFLSGIKADYEKLGYTVKETTLDTKKVQLIITNAISQYRVTVFDGIPNEYQSLMKTGFSVEVVPSMVIKVEE